MLPSPSSLVASAFRLETPGTPAETDVVCAQCGVRCPTGTPVVPFRPGSNFLDGFSLACPQSRHLCAPCAALSTKKIMTVLNGFVATNKAVYPIRRNTHRAWFLLSPPRPPFVAAISDSKLQHLVWRTPLTLDDRLLHLRLGARLLRICRPLLLEAVAIVRGFDGPVFRVLDRMLRDPAHGQFTHKALQQLPKQQLDTLIRLGPGEMWALSVLGLRNPVAPERPDPIML